MTDQKNKSGLDEQTFAKLLEAAYVLQEHNLKNSKMEVNPGSDGEEVRKQGSEIRPAPAKDVSHANSDYTLTLAEIVEVQNQIQIRHLEADQAMALVVERIARITNASGAAIGIMDGETIRYRAGAGASALPSGSEVPVEDAICARCLRTGPVSYTHLDVYKRQGLDRGRQHPLPAVEARGPRGRRGRPAHRPLAIGHPRR